MSAEAWALFGVVVGAIIGGLAQVVADWLRARREAKDRTREIRREAYTELLAAETHAFSEMNIASIISKSKAVPMDQNITQLLAGRAAQARLHVALAHVALVGPQATRNAAAALMQVSTDQITAETIDGGSIQRARDNFLRLAKRDLGIDDDGDGEWLASA